MLVPCYALSTIFDSTKDILLKIGSSKAQISREPILESARDLNLILARGFAAMSIDAVCESASITKGGFFHHFSSKDAHGEAVLDKFWNDVEAR